MIKTIHIENFKSCKDVTLENLGSITALVGKNAAGKTNVLRAINWFAGMATAVTETRLSERLEPLWSQRPTRVSAEIQIKKATYLYLVEVGSQPLESSSSPVTPEPVVNESLSVKNSGEGERQVFSRKGTEIQVLWTGESLNIGGLVGSMPAMFSLLPRSNEVVRMLIPLFRFLGEIRYYPLDEPSRLTDSIDRFGIADESEYKTWLANYRRTDNPGDSVTMRLLQMALDAPEKIQEIESIAGSNGLGLIERIVGGLYPVSRENVAAEPTQPERRIYFLHFVSAHSPRRGRSVIAFNFADLSLGTRRVLRILASLFFDESTVMLMEHPEDGIHAGLVRRLVPLFRKYLGHTQLFLSSHSATILNMLGPSDVRLVQMKDGETKARALTQRELRAATAYITESGGALDDFLEPLQGE